MRQLQLCIALTVASLFFTFRISGQNTDMRTAVKEDPKVDVLNRGEMPSNPPDDRSPLPPTSRLVEAENMKLTGYQIDRDESCTYIKLTNSTGIAEFT